MTTQAYKDMIAALMDDHFSLRDIDRPQELHDCVSDSIGHEIIYLPHFDIQQYLEKNL